MFRIIINKVIKIFIFLNKLNLNTTAKINDYNINVPFNYALNKYQNKHKLYDKFLPSFIKHFSSNDLIIDIGANVGDTVISLIQNCENPLLCIEPSDIFYPYLEKNINMLPTNDKLRVSTLKCFIGTGQYSGSLSHLTAGTAKLVIKSESKSTFMTLDDILKSKSNVSLIKIDTDGYDFDVIQSGLVEIERLKPMLYWENYIENDFQLKGFNSIYEKLAKIGYDYICIFDNFGNIITISDNFKTITDINNYLYSQLTYNCTRTFNYTDVLATTKRHFEEANLSILDYKKYYITM